MLGCIDTIVLLTATATKNHWQQDLRSVTWLVLLATKREKTIVFVFQCPPCRIASRNELMQAKGKNLEASRWIGGFVARASVEEILNSLLGFWLV